MKLMKIVEFKLVFGIFLNSYIVQCLLSAFKKEHSFPLNSFKFQVGDVVKYHIIETELKSESRKSFGLGAFLDRNSIQPLCLREEVHDNYGHEISLYYNEDVTGIPVNAIEIEYILDNAIYTQRTIEDRIANPHGEHAEDVWIVSTNTLKTLLVDTVVPIVKFSH